MPLMPNAPRPGYAIVQTQGGSTRALFVRDYADDAAITALIARKLPGGKGNSSFPLRDVGGARMQLLENQLEHERLLGVPPGNGIEELFSEMAESVRRSLPNS